MEALPGRLGTYQYCREFGSYVTFTIPCEDLEEKLAAEERRRAFSVMMSAAARQQSKPLLLPGMKGKGRTDRGD